jgi:hypothetical protein
VKIILTKGAFTRKLLDYYRLIRNMIVVVMQFYFLNVKVVILHSNNLLIYVLDSVMLFLLVPYYFGVLPRINLLRFLFILFSPLRTYSLLTISNIDLLGQSSLMVDFASIAYL